MKTPIKYPEVLAGIVFVLAGCAFKWGLPNVADWITYCYGVVGLYWILTNRFNKPTS